MCCIRAAQTVCAKSMIKASVCTFGIGYLLIEMSISLDDTNEEYLINIPNIIKAFYNKSL